MNIAVENAVTALSRASRTMFWTRVLTSAVLAPAALGAAYIGYPVFHILSAAMAAAVLWEFVQIVETRPMSTIIGFALFVTVLSIGIATANTGLAIGSVLVGWVVLVLLDRSHRCFTGASIQAGLLYAALPAIGIVVVESTGGSATIFWLFAVVWGTDVGAYAAGQLIGGPRLAPVISPKKTWSGAIGGVALAFAAASLVTTLTGGSMNLTGAIAAIVLSIVSQLGDLAQSRFKRQHDVKDSGTWVPGHGGVMDRVDGLWTAAPLTALVCIARDGGVGSW